MQEHHNDFLADDTIIFLDLSEYADLGSKTISAHSFITSVELAG